MNNRLSKMLLSLLTCAAMSAALQAGESGAIRIGVCLSLTGVGSLPGTEALAGMQIRMDELNAAGGEQRWELVIRDDESNPETALRAATELIEQENVIAVLGPTDTNISLALRPLANEKKIVFISPTATNPSIGRDGEYFFRLMFDDAFQGRAMAEFVYRTLHMRRAGAVLDDSYEYSASVYDRFREQFEKEGGEMVGTAHFKSGGEDRHAPDFAAAIGQMREARPDILFLPLRPREVAALLRASLAGGLGTRYCGADSWENAELLLSSGNNLENSYYISGVNPEADTPEMRRFLEAYDNSDYPDATLGSVLGYDSMSLIARAVATADSREALREALYDLRGVALATGPIVIDRREGTFRPGYIHRINKHGTEFRTMFIDMVLPEVLQPPEPEKAAPRARQKP